MSDAPPDPPTPGRRIRWWPAILILLFAVCAAVWVRFNYGRQRQDQNIAIAEIAIIAAVLLVLWCLLLSRFESKLRLGILFAVLSLFILVPSLFRIRGVTGDLVPILEWRWQRNIAVVQHTSAVSALNSLASAISLTNNYPQFLGP